MTTMTRHLTFFLVTAASCWAHSRQHTVGKETKVWTGFGAQQPTEIKSSEGPQQQQQQQQPSAHSSASATSQSSNSSLYEPAVSLNATESRYEPAVSLNDTESRYEPAVSLNATESRYEPAVSLNATESRYEPAVSLNATESRYEPAVSLNATESRGDISSVSSEALNITEEFVVNSTDKGSAGRVDLVPESVVSCFEESAGEYIHFTCQTVQAFYKLASEGPRNKSVSVSIKTVDGELSLEPLTNLTLTELTLIRANITSFTHQRQDLTLLTKLDLTDNPDLIISSLCQLGTLPALCKLTMHGTVLSSSGSMLRQVLQQLPSLKHLDVSSTSLTVFNSSIFSHNSDLETLNLAENEFNNITLDEGLLRQLTTLNLTGCRLREIQVRPSTTQVLLNPVPQAHTRLRHLSLAGNLLTHLPASLIAIVSANNANLNITDNLWNESCSNCSLYHLWQYSSDNPHLVEGGEDLRCFKQDEALASCGWQDCPIGCTCSEVTSIVDCRGSELLTIPTVGPADTLTLLLQNNTLSDLSGINSAAWCNLKALYVQGNRLTTVVPPGTVGHCNCYDEEVFYREEHTCFPQQLKTLELSNNHLKRFSHWDCNLLYPVKRLYLSLNMMDSMRAKACGALWRLETLTVSRNKLSNLTEPDLAMYPSLKQLNLDYNSLVTLPTTITRFMPNLRILDVSHNLLHSFSGGASTPESPFASLIVSHLEVLRLNHNNFSQIVPMFDLKDLNTLKKLTLTHNKWSCNCDNLNALPVKVMTQLDNQALIQALAVVECNQPLHLKGYTLKHLNITSECPESNHDRVFLQLVASLIMAVILFLIVYNGWKRITRLTSPLRARERDLTNGRKHDVFVVHAYADNELVKQEIIGPLVSLGYSVAWHDNAFPPGEYIAASVEQAVKNSRRMLVVATENLVRSRWANFEIRRGHHEELDMCGFKVSAIVMDTLPIAVPHDIYNLVAVRTHIVHRNSDYLKKLEEFLPTPRTQPGRDTTNSTPGVDIAWILEDLRKRKREAHIPLSEVFSIHLNTSHVSINVDIPNTESLTEEDCRKMVDRFKTRLPMDYSLCQQPHTISTEYELLDSALGIEEEEVAQIEGFMKDLSHRSSCRF